MIIVVVVVIVIVVVVVFVLVLVIAAVVVGGGLGGGDNLAWEALVARGPRGEFRLNVTSPRSMPTITCNNHTQRLPSARWIMSDVVPCRACFVGTVDGFALLGARMARVVLSRQF